MLVRRLNGRLPYEEVGNPGILTENLRVGKSILTRGTG
jgi:hypothetical protein